MFDALKTEFEGTFRIQIILILDYACLMVGKQNEMITQEGSASPKASGRRWIMRWVLRVVDE